MWVRAVLLVSAAAAAQIPWPGAMFYPLDTEVGNVERVSDDVLAQRLQGKRALVVGGTDGIGKGTALTLAKGGASVTVVGHSPTKASAMLKDMAAVASRPLEQHFQAYAVDLFTVLGCMNLTRQIKASGARFDFAVLTVGIWPDGNDPKTSDGIDKVIALDVLARYVVTRELLPVFNTGARIMSVLGSTVKVPPSPAEQTIKDIAAGSRTKYGLGDILGSAGALGDAWMQRMAVLLRPNVSLVGTWPGVVGDDLVSHSRTFPWWLRPFLAAGDKLVGMSIEDAGAIHAQILTSPNAARRPVSYFNVKLEGRRTNPLAYDEAFQDWAWQFLEGALANHSGHRSVEVTV